VLRGLDSYSYDKAPNMADDQRRAFARLEHVAIARPHFLALGLDMLPCDRAARHRADGMPIVAWTVRKPEQWDAIKDGCDNLIFEGFAPSQEAQA
jgi:glycerophosphoryl diester phosphodiesterase